jgi:hypothetical protein
MIKDTFLTAAIISSFIAVYIWAQFKDDADDVAEKTACIEVHAKLNRSESTILCGTLVKEN